MADPEEHLRQSALDELWDYGDPGLSETRFAEARLSAGSAVAEAEFATQQARALGLQGRFEEGHALLDDIGYDDPVVAVRVLLERGRLYNSAGQAQHAAPLFTAAAEQAQVCGATFLAADALHMVGIAEPDTIESCTAHAFALI